MASDQLKSSLSSAVRVLIASGAGSAAIMGAFLTEREGDGSRHLRAYQDGVRVWTACRGVTRFKGQPIRQGMVFSKAECEELDASELGKALNDLDDLVTVPLSEPARAGIASFCTYNIGATKCADSTFLRLLNEGKRGPACDQILLWIRDGGKDCRIRSNNCYGQIERRKQERELCLITAGETA